MTAGTLLTGTAQALADTRGASGRSAIAAAQEVERAAAEHATQLEVAKKGAMLAHRREAEERARRVAAEASARAKARELAAAKAPAAKALEAAQALMAEAEAKIGGTPAQLGGLAAAVGAAERVLLHRVHGALHAWRSATHALRAALLREAAEAEVGDSADRDHNSHRISATFTYDGGHFSQVEDSAEELEALRIEVGELELRRRAACASESMLSKMLGGARAHAVHAVLATRGLCAAFARWAACVTASFHQPLLIIITELLIIIRWAACATASFHQLAADATVRGYRSHGLALSRRAGSLACASALSAACRGLRNAAAASFERWRGVATVLLLQVGEARLALDLSRYEAIAEAAVASERLALESARAAAERQDKSERAAARARTGVSARLERETRLVTEAVAGREAAEAALAEQRSHVAAAKAESRGMIARLSKARCREQQLVREIRSAADKCAAAERAQVEAARTAALERDRSFFERDREIEEDSQRAIAGLDTRLRRELRAPRVRGHPDEAGLGAREDGSAGGEAQGAAVPVGAEVGPAAATASPGAAPAASGNVPEEAVAALAPPPAVEAQPSPSASSLPSPARSPARTPLAPVSPPSPRDAAEQPAQPAASPASHAGELKKVAPRVYGGIYRDGSQPLLAAGHHPLSVPEPSHATAEKRRRATRRSAALGRTTLSRAFRSATTLSTAVAQWRAALFAMSAHRRAEASCLQLEGLSAELRSLEEGRAGAEAEARAAALRRATMSLDAADLGRALWAWSTTVHRDHYLHSISASCTYDGGRFLNRCTARRSGQ